MNLWTKIRSVFETMFKWVDINMRHWSRKIFMRARSQEHKVKKCFRSTCQQKVVELLRDLRRLKKSMN